MHFEHFNISDQFGDQTLPAHAAEWMLTPLSHPENLISEKEFPYKFNMRVLSCCFSPHVDPEKKIALKVKL